MLLLACGAISGGAEERLPGPLVPPSRLGHSGIDRAPRGEDGRFENTVGPLPHAGPTVTFPFFLRRALGAFRDPRRLPEISNPVPDYLRVNARIMRPAVTWVGHATLLVQLGGATILTDPIWSNRAGPTRFAGARRYLPPGLPLEALPPIDVVLISHNHYDHLDLPTLRWLSKHHRQALFVLPLGNGSLLRRKGIERVVELDWGDQIVVKGVTVHCLPAQHWSRRALFDARKALWSSWAVTAWERRFYFAGDTGYFDGLREIGRALGPFDLAAVPIGAYEPQAMMRPFHLDPEQAVQAGLDVDARRVLGVHFGTFDLSDEPLDEPPRRFHAAARAAGLAPSDAWTLGIGETRDF
ncbi:MAG: MBL fold metallo-hydrolase [Myxococcota bacterium]